MSELVVVPSERHALRLAREGVRAETRASLRARLIVAFLPDMAFADALQCRLALAMALAESDGRADVRSRPRASGGGQLDLFAAAAAAGASGDPLLASLRASAGASWVRTVDALDRALGELRLRGAESDLLDTVASRARGVASSRARVLSLAMRALDERLFRARLRDGRTSPWLLARALDGLAASGDLARLLEVVSASRVRARWILAWEPADLAWFRALDAALGQVSGHARIILPAVDRPLEGSRERDAFEVLADDVARALDAAPEPEIVPAALGDVTGGTSPPVDPSRVRILGASDASAQARAVVHVVREALAAGAPVERVAVALPSSDERTLAPLRRAFEAARIPISEARGAPMSGAPVVAAALAALEAAASLERVSFARVAGSGYVDAERLAPEGTDRREAARALARAARELEASPTAAGVDAAARLVATVEAAIARARGQETASSAGPSLEVAIVRTLAARFVEAAPAATRGARVVAARTLWAALGLGLRAGRGGLSAFTRDEAPEGVARAERLAIARDTRAWEALSGALDAYEAAALSMGGLEQPVSAEVFRLEIESLLDESGFVPGAARAGALRLAPLVDITGEQLDLLVVIDVAAGTLPKDPSEDALVSESLSEALEKASRTTYRRRDVTVLRARQLGALAAGASEASRIVLCFPREDGAGAPLAPSPVIDFLERAGVPVAQAPSAPRSAASLGVRRRARSELLRETFFLDPARPRSDVVGTLAPDPSLASVREILTRETGGGSRALAVTGLERFAKCAFQGYAYVVLSAREAERQGELPDAREEGNLLHEALAAAFSATAAAWTERPRPAERIRAESLAAADQVLARSTGHAELRAVTRLRVRDAVRAVVDASLSDETWDFAHAEQSFGGARARGPGGAGDGASPSPWPPLVLDDGREKVTLRGGIDRIDLSHGRAAARVVDYKRSKSTVTASMTSLGDTALQIPLYACVVARHEGLPTTGVYLPTQPRDLAEQASSSGRSGARARGVLDDLVRRDAEGLAPIERRALELLGRVRLGDLAPVPADEGECKRCSVSGACRKPRFAMNAQDDESEGEESGG